jgi:hypothetical protein
VLAGSVVPAGRGAAQVPVDATVAGQRVVTTVDAEVAAYYLEQYLEGNRADPDLHGAIARGLADLDPAPSDAEGLRRLAERFSTDFATIHFIRRLYEEPANRRAQDAFHRRVEELRAGARPCPMPLPEGSSRHLFAFVPGYAYRRGRDTGADFARQRGLLERQGLRTLLIETDDLGSVEDNASVVARELARLGQEGEQVILISASKGGPEAALALGERLRPQAVGHVRAWISVGGLLRGSPYADLSLRGYRRWLARIVFTFRGVRMEVIRNLSTEVRRPAFAALRLPPDLLTLQYVGAPLSGQVERRTRERYRALRHLGPNDGLTLLADELVPRGIVVTELGLDHYYRDPSIDLKTLALVCVVLEQLGRKDAPPRPGSAEPGPDPLGDRARREPVVLGHDRARRGGPEPVHPDGQPVGAGQRAPGVGPPRLDRRDRHAPRE